MRAKKDAAYIAARNKLIPQAEDFANKQVGKLALRVMDEATAAKWNRAFHKKMTLLARKAGIAP